MHLVGCAAKRSVEPRTHDYYGGYQIVSKHNDLYVEMPDGRHSRRITYTPHIHELVAFFTDDGEYIMYCEGDDFDIDGTTKSENHYRIKATSTGRNREKISHEEWLTYYLENL